MARNYSNTTVETTLVNAVGPSDTLVRIADTTGMPVSFPFSLILDYQGSNIEVVTVTGLSGPDFTVTRGEDGTGAQAHDAGAVVVHGGTARDFFEPQTHIDATSAHGVGGTADVVGTDTTQTLTNKTITASANTLTVDVDDLADVNASTPSDGDLLGFDSGTSTWVAVSSGAPDVQVFTTSGTWNKPANARSVNVRMVGGGGAGGGAVATSGGFNSVGSGGGGGAYAESTFDAASLGSSETVTVGAGGTGVSGDDGNDGNNSVFGASLVVADEGGGGIALNIQVDFPIIREGGTGGFIFSSTGDIIIEGGYGGPAILKEVNEDGISGFGGASHLGGGIGGRSGGAGSGGTGRQYGGGGAGAIRQTDGSSLAGGAGSDGLVIVTTYF